MYPLTALLSFVPLDSPQASFLYPLFGHPGGNAVYLHELDSGARVRSFNAVNPNNYFVIENDLPVLKCQEGGAGVFAVRLNNGMVICDHYAPFFRKLAGLNLGALGSAFFNADAYLMLRDFPARANAINVAAKQFRNPDNGRLWAQMENSNNESGLFLPDVNPGVQSGILGAARGSDDLRRRIEQQIANLKHVHKTPTPIDIPEGRVARVSLLAPRSIDIWGVDVEHQQAPNTYRCQLHFTTIMGARADMENGGPVTFDTVVQSGARMVVDYSLDAPNTLGVRELSLGDYDVEDRELIRLRRGGAATA